VTDLLKLAEELEDGDHRDNQCPRCWECCTCCADPKFRKTVAAALRLAEAVVPDDVHGYCQFCANATPGTHEPTCVWATFRAAREGS